MNLFMKVLCYIFFSKTFLKFVCTIFLARSMCRKMALCKCVTRKVYGGAMRRDLVDSVFEIDYESMELSRYMKHMFTN